MPDTAGFTGATIDSRLVRPGMLFVALRGANRDGRDFIPAALEKGAAGVIDGLDELAEFASAYRRTLRARVAGVTGSAGKTTTKELLRSFLSAAGKVHATEGNFNNHIGLPLTILNTPRDADFLVLEMGTSSPGEIAHLCSVAAPDCGAVTNVGTAHIEFFGSREAIAREKGELLAASRDFGVVSRESDMLEILRGKCSGEFVEADTSAPWMADALRGVLPGAHNVSNACIAFALAERLGVRRESVPDALARFSLPGSRWRKTEIGGVLFIDDTYNANPDSMCAAIDAFAAEPCRGRRIAILGDMFELGPGSAGYHRRVFARAAEKRLDLVVGVGRQSSLCPCDVARETVDALCDDPGFDLSTGDAVLLKASHGMALGRFLEAMKKETTGR